MALASYRFACQRVVRASWLEVCPAMTIVRRKKKPPISTSSEGSIPIRLPWDFRPKIENVFNVEAGLGDTALVEEPEAL
jgi:hypothetical protein